MLFYPVETKFWKNINFDDKIGKTVVKKLDSYKYLGVIIDININCLEHL